MKSTRIIHDREWNEYRVKFYEGGEHLKDADYHTDDKQDAEDTAAHFMRGGGKP